METSRLRGVVQSTVAGSIGTPLGFDMKMVLENHAVEASLEEGSGAAPGHGLLLTLLGDDLRELYRDMTEIEQPEQLVDLAMVIDALSSGGSEGA